MNPEQMFSTNQKEAELEKALQQTDIDKETQKQILPYMRDTPLFAGTPNMLQDVVGIASMLENRPESSLESISPLPTYENHIEEIHKNVPEAAAFIIEYSDPEAKKELNKIIAEFNDDLPRIKSKKDTGAIESFVKSAKSIINGN